MVDRSSRPTSMPQATARLWPSASSRLRRQRLTGKHIAREVGVSPATVSRVLKRAGLSRLKDIEPAEPVRRYEREHPGEMIHIDIKKLGRFERVGHRITGDRAGRAPVAAGGARLGVRPCRHRRRLPHRLQPGSCPTRSKESAVAFLEAARRLLRQPRRHRSQRVMTDNGSCL